MKEEIKRRLDVLNNYKVKSISQINLRGGMQDRLHRQERLRNGRDIEAQRKKLINTLSLIEQEKQDSIGEDFRILSSIEPLGEFHKPELRRIRSKRGFF